MKLEEVKTNRTARTQLRYSEIRDIMKVCVNSTSKRDALIYLKLFEKRLTSYDIESIVNKINKEFFYENTRID